MTTDILTQIGDAIKRTPANIVGGGVDLANLLSGLVSGKGLSGLVDTPVGGSKSLNTAFGLKEPQTAPQETAEMALSMLSPGAAAKGAALSLGALLVGMSGAKKGAKLATGPGAKQAGMIVPASDILDFQTFNKVTKELKAGVDPEYVFKSTGAFKSPQDDVLRAVISDLGASIKPHALIGANKATQLSDILAHPELFSKIPILQYIGVKPTLGYRAASYTPGDFSQGIPGTMYFGGFSDQNDFLSAILHETQHGVQTYGKMGMGGSPDMFLTDKARLVKGQRAATTEYDRLLRELNDAADKAGVGRFSAESKKLPEHAKMAAVRKESIALDKVSTNAIDNYLKLPGEAESRLVEKMRAEGKGAETFPPKFQSQFPDLASELDLPSPYYLDLAPKIQALLNKYLP